jgi:hypothetical protein
MPMDLTGCSYSKPGALRYEAIVIGFEGPNPYRRYERTPHASIAGAFRECFSLHDWLDPSGWRGAASSEL